MDRSEFLSRFGGVFEHSAWIAERAWDKGSLPAALDAGNVHAALSTEFRLASEDERLKVLRAHPDLAGKLAVAGELTDDSRNEQAGAGLDRLSETEFARFTDLNTRYQTKFGFPFIIAVKGLGKDEILHAFENRIHHTRPVEFETACREVEKIAALRLKAMTF
ncbi:2-oxo-4-hydroxy-4-carboxy-5-ureidoimidazoline decarboxylase [Rhizobium sp. KVB221]|uniref:2-oxo-4-hydroxy-4-carboxy-5-ureidoimidazoline decarboxylase n=1 Tax=Rhizobium setariae TaxID=2801340 RepID=A0A936YIQ9_9HYPH|nr:2-oxo-4-hydroxy-4-carboxy-5-ureidoimidazoline decarboxylase [Rhizobium setariae]MBL0371024.1 2-oxo-4-hydroxy-4-carboxy-5-ureidoimidazoline decarboxylase [Rhizobium setariae]